MVITSESDAVVEFPELVARERRWLEAELPHVVEKIRRDRDVVAFDVVGGVERPVPFAIGHDVILEQRFASIECTGGRPRSTDEQRTCRQVAGGSVAIAEWSRTLVDAGSLRVTVSDFAEVAEGPHQPTCSRARRFRGTASARELERPLR